MTVSNGAPSPGGNTVKASPVQASTPATTYADALTTASVDPQSTSTPKASTAAETRADKAQLARSSTSGVARSIGREGHHATSPGRATDPKSSSAHHQGRDRGPDHAGSRSCASSDSHKGKSAAPAGAGGGGAGEMRKGGEARKKDGVPANGMTKAKSEGAKALSTSSKTSERSAVKAADKAAKDGMGSAKGLVMAADRGKMSSPYATRHDKGDKRVAIHDKMSKLSAKAQQTDARADPYGGSMRLLHHQHAAHHRQNAMRPLGAHQHHHAMLAENAGGQPGGAHQPTPYHQGQHHVPQIQGVPHAAGDYQHHYGGLGVGAGGASPDSGMMQASAEKTPLGQLILAALLGMQSIESEAGKCALAHHACSSCAAGEGGEAQSDFAGGMSSLEQLLQLLKELVGRSDRISGGEKTEIFGMIARMLRGDKPATA